MNEEAVLPLVCPPPDITNPGDRDQQKAAFDWIKQNVPQLDLVEAARTPGFDDMVSLLLLTVAYDAPQFFHVTGAAMRHAKRLARRKASAPI
jgi:hypothetical protein